MSGVSARRAVGLMQAVTAASVCPCHGAIGAVHVRHNATPAASDTDYAVEMAASTIRYGHGCTREIGMDLGALKARNVMVVTDKFLRNTSAVESVVEAIEREKIKYTVFDRVRIEPTDGSFMDAIDFAKAGKFDAFVAVGGGSVIDTTKAANLYSTHPADFLQYVNAPVGRGMPVPGPLKPLIAVPTTAGTGSETTGAAIFDYVPRNAKTGIANRALKPTLGLVDPLNMRTMPTQVMLASALDVLCHSLESFTAIPYNKRTPRPASPTLRPAYQGSNPFSDVWSQESLKIAIQALPRIMEDRTDLKAIDQMCLAATYAGIGFGNAGVHLCHGMSYAVSGLVKEYKHKEYQVDYPIVPHGISVALNAPAVFRFTGPACPDRHRIAAAAFGAKNVDRVKDADAGHLLADELIKFYEKVGVPNGLQSVGYTEADIPELVEGTLPQHRVTKLSPEPVDRAALEELFRNAMKY